MCPSICPRQAHLADQRPQGDPPLFALLHQSVPDEGRQLVKQPLFILMLYCVGQRHILDLDVQGWVDYLQRR